MALLAGREALLEGTVPGLSGPINEQPAEQPRARAGGRTEPSIPADGAKHGAKVHAYHLGGQRQRLLDCGTERLARVHTVERILEDDLQLGAQLAQTRAGDASDLAAIEKERAGGGLDQLQDAAPDGGPLSPTSPSASLPNLMPTVQSGSLNSVFSVATSPGFMLHDAEDTRPVSRVGVNYHQALGHAPRPLKRRWSNSHKGLIVLDLAVCD